MSRKTAVSVLFVLLFALVGTAVPAHALTGDASSLRVLIGEQSPAGDPDGVYSPTPAAPDGTFLQVIRQILGFFVL